VRIIAFSRGNNAILPKCYKRNGAVKMAKAVKKTHKKGLDGRAEERGKISRKHGNTRIDTLRKTYGEHFAAGRRGDMHLATLLKETGSESLHEYLRHHHKG
jgi:hypothetical protein